MNSQLFLLIIGLFADVASSATPILSAINTPHLTIRRILAEDSPRYNEVFGNPQAMDKANSETATSEGMENKVQKIIFDMDALENFGEIKSSTNLGFAIVDRASGRTIGFSTFTRGPAMPYFVTTTVLEPESWGSGLGTEARKAINGFLFNQLGIDGLISRISPDNQASLRVTEKIGFQRLRSRSSDSPTLRDFPFFEYRLSRLRYEGRSFTPHVLEPYTPSEKVCKDLDYYFYDRNLPPSAKASLFYKAMINDLGFLDHFGPEYASVVAEELAHSRERDLGDALKKIIQEIRQNVQTANCAESLVHSAKPNGAGKNNP